MILDIQIMGVINDVRSQPKRIVAVQAESSSVMEVKSCNDQVPEASTTPVKALVGQKRVARIQSTSVTQLDVSHVAVTG